MRDKKTTCGVSGWHSCAEVKVKFSDLSGSSTFLCGIVWGLNNRNVLFILPEAGKFEIRAL